MCQSELDRMRKELVRRIQQESLKDCKVHFCGMRVQGSRYVESKVNWRLESYPDGSDGAKVQMRCRGDSSIV